MLYGKKQKTMMGNRNHVVREKRLAKTLFIITAASLLTWLPFQILLLLIGNLDYVNPPVLMIIKFLQFSNSLVNVTIYPFRISEFKNTLLQMLRCCAGVCPRDRRIEVGPMHQGSWDWIIFIMLKNDTFQFISKYSSSCKHQHTI